MSERTGLGLNASRRAVLGGVAALGGVSLLPRQAKAQARLAPPVIIRANTLIMSINPTLPPLQFVNEDRKSVV